MKIQWIGLLAVFFTSGCDLFKEETPKSRLTGTWTFADQDGNVADAPSFILKDEAWDDEAEVWTGTFVDLFRDPEDPCDIQTQGDYEATRDELDMTWGSDSLSVDYEVGDSTLKFISQSTGEVDYYIQETEC